MVNLIYSKNYGSSAFRNKKGDEGEPNPNPGPIIVNIHPSRHLKRNTREKQYCQETSTAH